MRRGLGIAVIVCAIWSNGWAAAQAQESGEVGGSLLDDLWGGWDLESNPDAGSDARLEEMWDESAGTSGTDLTEGISDEEVQAFYDSMVESGLASFQFVLGEMHRDGDGMEQDAVIASQWFRKAAVQGHADAAYALGRLYQEGRGVSRDEQEAFVWFRMAAIQAHPAAIAVHDAVVLAGLDIMRLLEADVDIQERLTPDAMRQIGLDAYTRGDFEVAIFMFRPLAAKDDAVAQFNLGWMAQHGEGLSRDAGVARGWYAKAAVWGHVGAQHNLGSMWANGVGGAQDYELARTWFRLAADQGHTEARYHMGWLYANGYGVAKDYEEALQWYRQASNKGHPRAQYAIAVMHANGLGVPRDFATALTHYEVAALNGHAPAQFDLGTFYRDGTGVEQDDGAALKWFRMAADQGHARSQYILGNMYEHGNGVTADNIPAYQWYVLSGTRGDMDADAAWNRIILRMSGAQLAEARRRIEAWKAQH